MATALKQRTSLETAVTEIYRSIALLVRRLRAEANPGDLTMSESAILARLEEQPWMTTAEIARKESVKPQSIGAALAVLEQAGLVQRKPHPTDGRQILFALSREGVATRQRKSLLKLQWISTAMAKLSAEEQETLIAAAALIKRLAES